jgi:hypothetical protein
MPFISITRLRVRSIRFLPSFVLSAYRSLRQAKASSGFQGGGLLADRSWTFWTMTACDFWTGVTRLLLCTGIRRKLPCRPGWKQI